MLQIHTTTLQIPNTPTYYIKYIKIGGHESGDSDDRGSDKRGSTACKYGKHYF